MRALTLTSDLVCRPISGDFPRVKSLRDPNVKMSKSDVNTKSRIELTDAHDVIRVKVQKAFSDTTPHVTYDPETRPGISNLLDIHAALTGKTVEEIVKESDGLDTKEYKAVLADVMETRIAPIREEMKRLEEDRGFVEEVLRTGAETANEIAAGTHREVMEAVGFR